VDRGVQCPGAVIHFGGNPVVKYEPGERRPAPPVKWTVEQRCLRVAGLTPLWAVAPFRRRVTSEEFVRLARAHLGGSYSVLKTETAPGQKSLTTVAFGCGCVLPVPAKALRGGTDVRPGV